ncbi:hypothetical protein [Fontibacter flavus]|uniref:Glycosyl transferase family 2 n=1 Tax=Fontibacter flavus TaxID=654838 RepID=A0ABV6FYL3_9BACT
MKISIIIPSQNNSTYLANLLPYLKSNTNRQQLEEILIVEELETRQLVKLAEKSHAKLYIFKNSDTNLKAEAGAFLAKGEILYFIKPGHFPPRDFASRIICAVELRIKLGSLYHPLIAKLCNYIQLPWIDRMVIFFSPISNLFILNRLFHQNGGLKYNGRASSLQEFLNKKEFRSTLGIIQ